jgi:hypothetical protein
VQVVRIERGRVGNGVFHYQNGNSPWSGRAEPPSPRPPPDLARRNPRFGRSKVVRSSGSTSVDFSRRACEDPIRYGRGVPSLCRGVSSLYCAYKEESHSRVMESQRSAQLCGPGLKIQRETPKFATTRLCRSLRRCVRGLGSPPRVTSHHAPSNFLRRQAHGRANPGDGA